ncbi:TlyA family rRNA (cytidine-2'-O)-methyltransferase [Nocardioides sp. dk4132]|uniref:TlyA family RNA methyltransferase n=1 Tax=unclassified Nocardioides TaxID=2615069 RepID=UPI0012969F33|nr:MULTISPECIES: TlyA family RNA methyltransferase [unclassified Nocardioides]MQW75352.1 TlyA family rRNA (cytidine-2'-O)-methyltransferase [Nocardioides sp. dk4132]QGA07503.1 TlyA family rRNA (cytidine-2'-O)-methyltransferase [Nocardioides sp. dk884]
MPPRRLRLDAELVRRGLARSREHASELIAAGRVKVQGAVASKPATGVTTDVALVVADDPDRPDYVSRGGHKLAGALAAFEPLGLRVEGRRCLDAGASTGGFTDVLLRHGAAQVVAVDVGYGQLAWRIQQDDRVVVHDRTNVRELSVELIGGSVDLVVGDLSFISLEIVLDALLGVTAEDGDLALMVKPQFEVGKDRVGKGGVVRDLGLRHEAVLGVAEAAGRRGWGARAVVTSPLPGPSGNVEFFLWLRRGPATIGSEEIRAEVERGPGEDVPSTPSRGATSSVPGERVEP